MTVQPHRKAVHEGELTKGKPNIDRKKKISVWMLMQEKVV